MRKRKTTAMTTMKMELTSSTNQNWWESEWYKEWEQSTKRKYHGKRDGAWYCYYNERQELVYVYLKKL